MKAYLQIQKFISVLMIFILFTYLSGCTSTMIIPKSGIASLNKSKYPIIVHGEQVKFLLNKKSTISNDTLSGKIKQTYMDNSYDAGNNIHLYLLSDSAIKLDKKGEFLSVPLNEVTKAEIPVTKGIGTPFGTFLGGFLLGGLLVFYIIGVVVFEF